MATSYLTQEGYDKLKKELEYLKTEKREEVAIRLREALDGSPLGVDADVEVEAAKNAQAFVEGRIQYLKGILNQAEIVNHLSETDVVQIGTEVSIKTSENEKETFTIVGRAEADPIEGRISNESPLGSALLGHSKGDEVDVLAPGGIYTVKITKIS
ncbi:MAG: transcription elongation factor GreA [Anaerolineales bacterium]|jgi:transcription elongation factor GreA|nr:transcription elongation factor GreA [Anaerolineales bacterium]MBS3752242.1 transcription elongation factor GreA [Anaerolineales bacterium]